MLPQGTLITRDAQMALLDLKKLVGSMAEKIRVAERETVGAAIEHRQPKILLPLCTTLSLLPSSSLFALSARWLFRKIFEPMTER